MNLARNAFDAFKRLGTPPRAGETNLAPTH